MKFSFWEKLGFGLLMTAWLVWGTNMIGNALVQVEPGTGGTAMASRGDSGAPAPAPGAPVADLKTLLTAATPQAGERAFGKCKACHTIEKGGPNRVGPNLWNVVGSAKGFHGAFAYSAPLKAKGGEWTYENLDAFLAKPNAYIPGTKMTFAGISRPDERAAIIAYLRQFSDAPKPLP